MTFSALLQQITDNPLPSIAIVGNLIILESLLSVDNAAVLATMVLDLKPKDRKKALRYGILGAYVFRGTAMVFASFLIRIWWLKPIGGLYLLYLVWDWWKGRQSEDKGDEFIDKNRNWLYRGTVGKLGPFWATVALVELMDMAFSMDNVFAAVAFTPNIILVCVGVFIGILAMRMIAGWFVQLMESYTFLETSAFLVIGILGIKLVLSLYQHFWPKTPFSRFLESHTAEIATSALTITIFFVPILTSLLFNYPRRMPKKAGVEEG
jgi:YkoY family integral membrane protein